MGIAGALPILRASTARGTRRQAATSCGRGRRFSSRSRASDILDGDLSGLVFLPGANLDLDMAAESGEKAHQPLQGNFGEFSSQDFRQLRLGGSNPPRCRALGQAERRDGFVQPKHEFSFQKMLFGIGQPELQPYVSRRVGSLAAGVVVMVVLPSP
jgi:hypothetical protein